MLCKKDMMGSTVLVLPLGLPLALVKPVEVHMTDLQK